MCGKNKLISSKYILIMKIVNALNMNLIDNDIKTCLFFIKDKNNDIDIVTFDKINKYINENKKENKILTEKGWSPNLSIINSYLEDKKSTTINEHYNGNSIISNKYVFDKRKLNMCAVLAAGNREHALITKEVLNSTVSCKKYFLDRFEHYRQPNKEYSKQIIASLQYIKMCIENE